MLLALNFSVQVVTVKKSTIFHSDPALGLSSAHTIGNKEMF